MTVAILLPRVQGREWGEAFHSAGEFCGNKAQKLCLHLWVPGKLGFRLDLLVGWRGGGVWWWGRGLWHSWAGAAAPRSHRDMAVQLLGWPSQGMGVGKRRE